MQRVISTTEVARFSFSLITANRRDDMNDPRIYFEVFVALVAIIALALATRALAREDQKDTRIRALEAENAALRSQIEVLMSVVRETHPNVLARHMTKAQAVLGHNG